MDEGPSPLMIVTILVLCIIMLSAIFAAIKVFFVKEPHQCAVNGPLQDPVCTPGAIFPNATTDVICQSGYTKTVRNVPQDEKDQVYAEYNIQHHTTGEYEVDHLISLELGGSNDITNLWPEAADPRPGFHEKDKIENYLHDQVCAGKMNLSDAQKIIATNWTVMLS